MILKLLFIAPFLLNLSLPLDTLLQILHLTLIIIIFLAIRSDTIPLKKLVICSVSLFIVLISLNMVKRKSGLIEYVQIYHHLGRAYELPVHIIDDIKQNFLKDMPEEKWCSKSNAGCWLNATPPQRPWSFNFSLGSESQYFKHVNSFRYKSFRDLKRQVQFSRFGKDGDTSYRSWPEPHHSGFIKREQIPYIIKLEASGNLSAGKEICWEGLTFINSVKKSIKGCEKLKQGTEIISYSGVNNPLVLRLSLSIVEKSALFFKIILTLFYLAYFFKSLNFSIFKKSPYILFLGMFVILSSFKSSRLKSPIFEGGDDGLTHSGFGTFILEELLNGRFVNALRGGEDIFYFMPGLRYLWPVNLIIFGSTAYFFMFFALMIPFFVYHISRKLFSDYDSKIMFIFAVLYTWSFRDFIVKGFPEAISYAAFLLGLFYLVNNLLKLVSYRQVFLSFLLITSACFLRPNLILSSFSICLIFFLIHIKNFKFILFSLMGSIPIFFSLIHNYIFGHAFVLFTSSATMDMNLFCKPADYLAFTKDLISLSFKQSHPVIIQIEGVFHNFPVSIIYLLPFFKLLFKKTDLKGWIIFLSFLGLFTTHFFWHPAGRYSWLTIFLAIIFTWDLYMAIFWRLIYFSSNVRKYFPLSDDVNLMKELKSNVTSLKGLNFLKFFYRAFIFPWKEIVNLIPENSKVCDIGCGSGFFLYILHRLKPSPNFYGIEISQSLIQSSQALFAQQGKLPFLTTYDGLNFPVEIQEAEVFVLNDVYHHIPLDLRASFIINLSKALISGKILIFKDMNAASSFWILFNKLHDLVFSKTWPREISLNDAKRLLKENGFKINEEQIVRKFFYSHFIIKAIKV